MTTTPSPAAIRAALAVLPGHREAYKHPEAYRTRLDTGEPSGYADEVRAEVHAAAAKIDAEFSALVDLASGTLPSTARPDDMISFDRQTLDKAWATLADYRGTL